MSSLEQHLQQLGNGHTAPQRRSGQGANIYVVYIRIRGYCIYMNEGNGGTCMHAHTHTRGEVSSEEKEWEGDWLLFSLLACKVIMKTKDNTWENTRNSCLVHSQTHHKLPWLPFAILSASDCPPQQPSLLWLQVAIRSLWKVPRSTSSSDQPSYCAYS